jgi:hypothetical protein
LAAGASLLAGVHGRPKLAVAAFAGGGRAALDAIERARFDVLGVAPRASRGLRMRALIGTLVEGRR